jgi:hypothetical protein
MEQLSMQHRVQIAILRQINEQNSVGRPTMSVVCPGADERDYPRALDLLFSEGAIVAPPAPHGLHILAVAGRPTLTQTGQQRLDDADHDDADHDRADHDRAPRR